MKTIPFTKEKIEELARNYPTPFYVYDAAGIRAQARKLIDAFSWDLKFKEHYAVKALPNPHILKLLREAGCGADCSSLPELVIADRAGVTGDDIMFSSNDTPAEEFIEAKKRGALLNLDSIEHLDYLGKTAGLPEIICFRYTPLLQFGNRIMGNPRESKFGLTREQIFEAYRRAKEKGIKRFGLHMMPMSNELRIDYHLQTVRELFTTAEELQKKFGIVFEFLNVGGGIGIPYKPEEQEFDIKAYAQGVKKLRDGLLGDNAPRMRMECGRYVTGPHGYLVSTVRHVKESYKRHVGLDATMANLMRPGMYGAYHHITVLGKEDAPLSQTCDVVGSLCENNDKFATDRQLPEIVPGDIVVIHDAGAHAHAMGFNYNGKLRSAEFLLDGGKFTMIRRAETMDDYFATLNF